MYAYAAYQGYGNYQQQQEHDTTTVALLLGMAVSHRGTMDPAVSNNLMQSQILIIVIGANDKKENQYRLSGQAIKFKQLGIHVWGAFEKGQDITSREVKDATISGDKISEVISLRDDSNPSSTGAQFSGRRLFGGGVSMLREAGLKGEIHSVPARHVDRGRRWAVGVRKGLRQWEDHIENPELTSSGGGSGTRAG
ncbi:uncharacterized protein A4U43_C04F25000 [Asparagus officinalis]|uniref:Uncharacterized protein n=1 Tax=Asparagus officinalis TaxID=4686 RepID=A0A5P1F3G0_ASPOF|nr:uncharacterized protein A4U43_C04F25000 [Asparagus officinalis]